MQPFSEWAVLGSNQRALPCAGRAHPRATLANAKLGATRIRKQTRVDGNATRKEPKQRPNLCTKSLIFASPSSKRPEKAESGGTQAQTGGTMICGLVLRS